MTRLMALVAGVGAVLLTGIVWAEVLRSVSGHHRVRRVAVH
jgi:hypothetical protein